MYTYLASFNSPFLSLFLLSFFNCLWQHYLNKAYFHGWIRQNLCRSLLICETSCTLVGSVSSLGCLDVPAVYSNGWVPLLIGQSLSPCAQMTGEEYWGRIEKPKAED